MEIYNNLSGKSNTVAYKIEQEAIVVQFAPSKYSVISFYKWDYSKAGQTIVENMKHLAVQGRGLNTYINTSEAKKSYSSKGSSLSDL